MVEKSIFSILLTQKMTNDWNQEVVLDETLIWDLRLQGMQDPVQVASSAEAESHN